MRNYQELTITHAQITQPWTVPYSDVLNEAVREDAGLGHLMGSHITLHATKTVGQIAGVFENLDHTGAPPSSEQLTLLRGRAADLVTAALRIANLYCFDLAHALVERCEEKNNVTLSWRGE